MNCSNHCWSYYNGYPRKNENEHREVAFAPLVFIRQKNNPKSLHSLQTYVKMLGTCYTKLSNNGKNFNPWISDDMKSWGWGGALPYMYSTGMLGEKDPLFWAKFALSLGTKMHDVHSGSVLNWEAKPHLTVFKIFPNWATFKSTLYPFMIRENIPALYTQPKKPQRNAYAGGSKQPPGKVPMDTPAA